MNTDKSIILGREILAEFELMSVNVPGSLNYNPKLGGPRELVDIMSKQPVPEGYKVMVVNQRIDLQQMDCALSFLHMDIPFFYDVDKGRLVMPIDKKVTMSITFTPEGAQAVMVAMSIAYFQ